MADNPSPLQPKQMRPLGSATRVRFVVQVLFAVLPKRPRSPRSTRRARAGSAVLWGIAVVLLAHVGLALAIETVVPQLRNPEYGYRLVRARALQQAHPDRPLVLVMGTSRTANGFNPSAAGVPNEPGAPLLFNFGISGTGPVHMRLYLESLRQNGVKPDAVVVELFLATLTLDVPAGNLCIPTATKLSADELRRLEPELTDPALVRPAWREARLNPWYAQRLVIMNHIAPDWLSWRQRIDQYWANTDQFGFDAYPVDKAAEKRPQRLASTRDGYFRAAKGTRVGPHVDRSIRLLLEECRATGTPVALFTMPESPTFRSWYTPESWAARSDYLRALSAEYGCPVFEAPGDYAEEDFADGHHMLPATAARFSREITERHIRPWLARLKK